MRIFAYEILPFNYVGYVQPVHKQASYITAIKPPRYDKNHPQSCLARHKILMYDPKLGPKDEKSSNISIAGIQENVEF